ncbi:MAG: hypothetical protein KDE11_06960 [Rhodobacteraceae bacterium]|nr:hypothetical protein [Paracoccaceae bacterium]
MRLAFFTPATIAGAVARDGGLCSPGCDREHDPNQIQAEKILKIHLF